jgi:Transglycosylase SLT domain
MIRPALTLAAGIVIGSACVSAANTAIDFWNTNRAPQAPVDIRTDKMRKTDPRLAALADKVADRFGVPRDTVRFHVMQESGWNPFAKNPSSSATGLTQPIIGSHSTIVGKKLTKEEHRALARDPEHNLNVGVAHIRACMDAMPGASARALWKRCHVAGHANVGTSIHAARAHYARVVEGSRFDTRRRFGSTAPVSAGWSATSFSVVQ